MQFGKIDGCQNLDSLGSTDEDYSGYMICADIANEPILSFICALK